VLDIRRIDAPVTPQDQFFTLQHYGQPTIDPAVWRLSIDGLVNKPLSLGLDELRKMGPTELVAGFECSGNGPGRVNGLASNGRWTGVPLRAVLARAGVKSDADEVVFFGADRGEEDVDFRGRIIKVTQQFGRSLSVPDATRPEPLLAYALNGEPLTKQQGFPVRLIVPGWYGVANVKWLSETHVQRGRYLGKFQARWYRTLRGESINGEVKYTEAEISRQQLKSVVARVTRADGAHRIQGFVLTDGTAVKSVEVRIDDGGFRPATLADAPSKDTWRQWRFDWDATPGRHDITVRAVDGTGDTQTEERADVLPDGASGWMSLAVTVTEADS